MLDTDLLPDIQQPDTQQQLGAVPSSAPVVPSSVPQLGAPVSQPPVQQVVAPQPMPQPVSPQQVPVQQAIIPGGTLPEAIRATPQQATIDDLNNLSQKQRLAKQVVTNEKGEVVGGDLGAEGARAEAKVYQDAATEKQNQADDFKNFLPISYGRIDKAISQQQQAYDDYKARAGSLKDPTEQYWADHSTGQRVLTGIMSVIAGAAAGFNKQENPVLNVLNKKIEQNYMAHKQNIDDLYRGAVESGKIVDTVENRNKYEQDAKLTSYHLSSLRYKDDLEAIKANTLGKVMPVIADKTIAGLEDQKNIARQNLAKKEADAAVTQLAQQRAKQKEVRDKYSEAYDKSLAQGASEDDARAAASKFVAGLGYDRSVLAPILSANGITADPKTGDFVFPETKKPANAGADVSLDEQGNLVVPTTDANGRRIKPEDQAKAKEEARKRLVTDDNNKQVLATDEKAAEDYRVHQSGYKDYLKAIQDMKDAVASGNEQDYTSARGKAIEIAPEVYGYKRGPSAAQAGETGGNGDQDVEKIKGTVASQLPEWNAGLLAKVPGPVGLVAGSPIVQRLEKNIIPKLPYELGTNTPEGKQQSALVAAEKSAEDIHNNKRQTAGLSATQTPATKPEVTKTVVAKGPEGKSYTFPVGSVPPGWQVQ